MGHFSLHFNKAGVNPIKKRPRISIAQIARKQKKRLKHSLNQKQRRLNELAQKAKQTDLVYQIHQTLVHHFPELIDWMQEIDDCRKKNRLMPSLNY